MHRIALLTLAFLVPTLAQDQRFLLTDVHVSPTARGFAQNFGGVLRAGRYVNRDATMLNLISAAYGVKEDGIAGGPGWMNSEIWDVVAKIPEGTNAATANLMLRALLADRFHLVVKNDTQPVPRYVLTVAKGGSKLKSSSNSGASTCRPTQQTAPPPPGADPASAPNITVECRNVTAADIAQNVQNMAGGYLDREVIDATKLEGSFDFELEWTARNSLAAKGPAGISIFDALEKQLGLKLEAKDVPLPALVVEHIDRKPTPNAPEVTTELATAPAKFEAATVKPVGPDDQPMLGLRYTGGSQMRAGGNLRQLIAMSLQISPNIAGDVLTGIAKSSDSVTWNITAKVPSTGEGAPNIVNGRPLPPPLSIGLEMLRELIFERFEVKTHIESRDITVYALTSSGKPKLTQAAESERTGCKPDNAAPKPVVNMGAMIACKNTTMRELADNLERMAGAYIDHPIVDATGLQGGWNFLMGWTPRAALQSQPPVSADGAAADPGGISVFEAMEKELGLKLVKQTHSYPVIVVDHVSEKPVE